MNFWHNSLGGYWLTLALMLVYLVILWVVWRLVGYIHFKLPENK